MDPVVKKKWIDALISGDYTQGQNALKNGDGTYCCLGVLCDLYVKAGCGDWEVNEDTDDEHERYQIEGQSGDLPRSVVKWAGLDRKSWESSDGPGGPGTQHRFIQRNDVEKLPFHKIANRILYEL